MITGATRVRFAMLCTYAQPIVLASHTAANTA